MSIERPLIAMEAEHGVLGALMHQPAQCETIGAFLAVEDFSDTDNGALYAMILGCHSKKITPDSVTLGDVCAELPSGDMTIVAASNIMRNVPSAANGVHYATIVVERSRARKLYDAGRRLMEIARESGNLADQISSAQALVLELNAQDDTPDVITLKEALGPVFADMQDRLDGIKHMGLEFGLSDLDAIINGARPGNLAIIAGRPGTGKTVLGLNLADKVAIRDGGSALVFSLEMSAKELAKRSLACLSGVSQNRIESGDGISDGEQSLQLHAAVEKMHGADVRICDKPALTFGRICSIARFQHRAKPLSVILIDYLSLIATDPASKLNRNQELGSYTRGFKALAKTLGVPIVLLAQLNRSIETRTDSKPKMSDLRDSGEIEQDADMIIMAHRDMATERGQNGITEIDVVKCRHSKPGFCLLQFQGEFARFVPAAQSSYEQPAKPEPALRKSTKSLMGQF